MYVSLDSNANRRLRSFIVGNAKIVITYKLHIHLIFQMNNGNTRIDTYGRYEFGTQDSE